jgi:GT2 family glycosyltransferase
MVAHPEIGFVGVGVEYVRPGGEALGEKLRRGLGDGEIDIRGGQARVFSYLFANKITFSGTMFRRDIYNKVGGFDESMMILEDRDFWVRCLSVSREGFLNEKLVRFRWHESNMSGLAVHKPRVYSEEARMIKKAGRGISNMALRLLLPLPISYVFFKLLKDPSLSHSARWQILLQLTGEFIG